MRTDKTLLSGNTTMLILKLLEQKDMYGYQIIEELANQSDNTFHLKTGTLYPLLHSLENDSMIESYDEKADSARIRKYYHLTNLGKTLLTNKEEEWTSYAKAVNHILEGGFNYANI